jgi:conjugal transfer pilus assembly protein TraW
LAVKVRLTRVGSKKNPIWRVVVADGRSPRDGRSIETIGHYNPQTQPSRIEIDRERLQHWLDRGAQPSNTVKKLIRAENTGHEMPAREAPTPVDTVTKTTRARTFHVDPSLVVPYAITDAEGKVIVAPGTRVNPLDTVSLSKQLLFFDARDAGQVTRAQAIVDEHQGKVKLILTGGSYLDLMRRWKRPVYFDQHGQLVERLGIRHVPALVSQDGKRLRIDEIL